jgi:tetratricopeptide (TPR) repeat protein
LASVIQAGGDSSRRTGEHSSGKVDFPISCGWEVQGAFTRAVALLHHMQYVEAEKGFEAVARKSPDCAIAYWGVAMTYMRPLWLDPGTRTEHLKKGRQAVERARAASTATVRERAYVSAVAGFYDAEGVEAQFRGWEAGMEMVYRDYPEDREAAAFYALAHLAVAPAELAHRERAAEVLETLRAEVPDHPGAIHYLIHAYDDPVLASRGVNAARAYDKIAPEVPHALHMPSHVFVRLGMWEDCVLWNQRSARAALGLPKVGGVTSNHYAHAMDYLVYAYLQQARDEEARKAISELQRNGPHEKEIGVAHALASVPARYALERRRWDEAADLDVREPESFPWADYPEIEASSWHARGIGAARTGDLEAARKAVEALGALHQRVSQRPVTECDWAATVDAQRRAVGAWIALAEEKADVARTLMREAVRLENSATACAATGWIMTVPALEVLGDLLLEMDNPAEALQAFEENLKITPNRFNSLYGAAHAAEQLGEHEAATTYYRQLLTISSGVDSRRAILQEAKDFLNGN